MSAKSLLRECIRGLITEETGYPAVGPMFEPHDPVSLKKGSGDYFIAREFGIKLTPQLEEILVATGNLRPDDPTELDENGVYWSEWELAIDINPYYHKGSPARLHGHPDTWHPGDPDEFEVEDYTIEGILLYKHGIIVLSPGDSQRLRDLLGDLTDREVDNIREKYIENLPEPDYDDFDDPF